MSSEVTNTPVISQTFSGLTNVLGRVFTFFAGFIRSLQVAQMAAALNRLGDTQLEKIGIDRSEVFAHAEKLIDGTENTK